MKTTLKLAALLALDLMAASVVSLTAIGSTARAQTTPTVPTFFARRDYPIGSQFIQIADVNGDGIPDLIAFDCGTIIVQFGNGDGTFRSGPNTKTGACGGSAFVAANLNGDGNVDMAISNGNGIVISMGNGDGTFQPSVNYPINDSIVGYLVVGDFNSDGILDIVATGNTGVWFLAGNGGGTFASAVLAVTLSGSFDIAAADFNQDGKLDVAVTRLGVGNYGAGFAVLLGNGNGTFQTPQLFDQPNHPLAIAVGSLTKGGPPSIALNAEKTEGAYLYFGNGAGGFTGPKVVSLSGGAYQALAIGDVNGDGRPDLVSGDGYVAYGEGDGNFSAPVSYPVDPYLYTTGLVLADLRNNGLTDIVVGAQYFISVLLNDDNKEFEDGIWTSVAGGAGCGVKGDFNGDGKPDLAVNNANGISILLGTGKGATPFTAGTNIALAGAECLVTTDLNGDGMLDLLVPAQGSVYAYLGNGDGTFTLASTTPTPSGGYLAPGDFNHDGNVDFATSGNLIALGNGDGTFQSPTDIVANPPEGGFSGIAAGDINNDGWKDLVLTSAVFPVDANATVLLNNHKGGFTQVPTAFGALTGQPLLADLNGDGNLDLILGGASGSGAEVYLGNGKGKFTSQPGLPGPFEATNGVNCVADVNGDGIPDILVLGYDTIMIYLGEGNATYATPFGIGTGPSPGSILVEHLHSQSVAAVPDIVVPDSSGGVMVLLNTTK